MEVVVSPEIKALVEEAKQAIVVDPSYLIDMLNSCGHSRKSTAA